MLMSCRFSIVGLHLLLLTNIAHSFVLLTANVDDVKKIARKFVSDSMAEKIADFIARATETMAHNMKVSEENENNADDQESSQVSAENRMYSAETPGFDSQAAETKSKEEIVLGRATVKIPRNTSVEKKRHQFEESSTHKTRKEPKSLHGRSRYVVQTENKASLATEIEDKYNKMKESIKLLEYNLYNTPDGKKKSKKPDGKKKNKGRAYKLLSAFDTDENDAEKDGTPDSKGPNYNARLNFRALDEKKALPLPTEEAVTEIEQHVNEKQSEEAVTVFDQQEVKDAKKDEIDHDENKIIAKTEKVPASGPGTYVTKKDVTEEEWWQRELPTHAHKLKSAGKTWF